MKPTQEFNSSGELMTWDRDSGQWIKEIPRRVDHQLIKPLTKNLIALCENAFDLLLEPPSENKWLIEHIWPSGNRGIIGGRPGIGKTWIAIAMGLAVVLGKLFLGKYAVKDPGPCLLVEEENSRDSLRTRIDALTKGMELTELEFAKLTDFKHLTRKFVRIPANQDEIAQLAKDCNAKLIIFDSLRRVHTAKENSSDEMSAVLESFGQIQQKSGASVILIHHLSKQSAVGDSRPIFERLRGSSDLWAWRDTVIGLEEEKGLDRAKMSFQFRDVEAMPPICVVREPMPNKGILLRAEDFQEQDTYREMIQRIIEALKEHGPITKTSLLKDFVIGNGGFKYRVFDYCAQKNFIQKTPDGKKWVCSENEFNFQQEQEVYGK